MQAAQYDTQDIVRALIDMKGLKIDEMVSRLETQFPGVDHDHIGQAIRIAQTSLIEQAASDFKEADALESIAAIIRRRQ